MTRLVHVAKACRSRQLRARRNGCGSKLRAAAGARRASLTRRNPRAPRRSRVPRADDDNKVATASRKLLQACVPAA
jgi:hypothetical protein